MSCLESFKNDSEQREQVSIILSSVSYRMVYIIHLKNRAFFLTLRTKL